MNTIGPLLITSCTLHVPESGSWVLEVDHDLPTGAPAPSGKVTCIVGGVPFVGTIAPSSSGVFGGTHARCRVVGAIEWRQTLPKRDYASPGGVLSSVVIGATAAELGIPAAVTAVTNLGPHVTRVGGRPASQVLGRSGWWVDAGGVTTVGPRPPTTAGPEFFLADYDPLERMARVTSDAPIFPGLVIADARLPGGVMRVREVTQTWSAEGSSASLWLGETSAPVQGPRLASAIQLLARAAVGPELLTHHEYTVAGQDPAGKYLLQAEVQGPVPNALPVDQWAGVPGLSCQVAPSSRVLVGFRGGEPVVLGFDASPAVSLSWDFQALALGGENAKPTANADVIARLVDLIVAVNAKLNGSATAPLDPASLEAMTGAIDAALAAMKTRSA